jgi:hypothetical protein
VKRPLVLALVSAIGVAAGIGAAYAAWRPYGDGSLTRAILRNCGTREAPRGDHRCSVLVDDALDAWFLRHYAGDAGPTASLDSGPPAPTPLPTDSVLDGLARSYAREHPICRTGVGVRLAWLRGFRGQPELLRDATDTTYLRATHDAYRAGAAYRSDVAARESKP